LAVIENNNGWDFRDVRGMRRTNKSSKRNDRECKGTLIAPLKAPSFVPRLIPSSLGFVHWSDWESAYGPKFRGADGKPTLEVPETLNLCEIKWLGLSAL